MDEARLKSILIEEARRALAELALASAGGPDATATHPATDPAIPASAAFPLPSSREATPPGLVVFSGGSPPAKAALEALSALPAEAHGAFRVALSFSFARTQCPRRLASALRGPRFLDDSQSEPELAAALGAARWVLLPDASFNTLNKALLGIEDSAPTRAIHGALRGPERLPLVLLESGEAPPPPAGFERLDLVRRLVARGALACSPETLATTLRDALDPPERRSFAAPPPRLVVRHRILTSEDVYEAARGGATELAVPEGTIVTAEARDDARRRGVRLVEPD